MRAARFLAILLLIAAILAGGLYLFRLPLAGWGVRMAMASAGFEQPRARVTALSLDHAGIENISARAGGGEAFSIARIDARYDWLRLLQDRAVDSLAVGPGAVRLALSEDGALSMPGLTMSGGGDGGGALPFRSVSLRDVAYVIDAVDGAASGAVTADYDVAKGGAAQMSLASERISWKGVLFSAVSGAGDVVLSADGAIAIEAAVNGDVATDGASAKGVAIALTGEGASWRDAVAGNTGALAGKARLDISAPDVELRQPEEQALMSADQMQMLFGEEIERASLAGAFDVSFSQGAIELRIAGDAPFALTTPDGGALEISAQGDAPLYAREGSRERASARFVLASDGVDAGGSADFERDGESWRFAAPLDIGAYDSAMLSLDRTSLLIDATSPSDSIINADVTVRSAVTKATIGRLAISDSPLRGAFSIAADTRARRAVITNKADCLTLDRVRGRIAEQDLEVSLEGVELCDNGAPIAVLTWAGDAACTVAGVLTATKGSLRLASTKANGRPPEIKFDATYHPSASRTAINGAIRGGSMTLNDGLDLADAQGRFAFTLDMATMRASATLGQLRVTQHRAADAPLLFAPLMAAGDGALEGDKARFNYVMTTPEGNRLGTGVGTHDMKTASGETVFSFGNLMFSPVGLQPNRLIPALKGIVDAAAGAVDGDVRFGWSPKGVTSSAAFEFDNVSFNGPTRAVTHTTGVSGNVALTNLMKVTTDGEQTITVDAVNMDALQLDDGVITFAFPGDDSFHLVKGEFPWFGGVIGVYGATASFNGQAEIPLKATNINLKDVLDYVQTEGLSGEGVLSGELPLIFEDGKARIVDGRLKSEGPGVIRYAGAASTAAIEAGDDAKLAFDFLRNLRYSSLEVVINGALDGQLTFNMTFDGLGDVTVQKRNVTNVPVLYRINLSVENIDLVRKAGLSSFIKSEIQRALEEIARQE